MYHGDHKIYCILAISLREEEKGSSVEIIEGGVNRTFVTLKLQSGRGHGLEYQLSVYANKTETVK